MDEFFELVKQHKEVLANIDEFISAGHLTADEAQIFKDAEEAGFSKKKAEILLSVKETISATKSSLGHLVESVGPLSTSDKSIVVSLGLEELNHESTSSSEGHHVLHEDVPDRSRYPSHCATSKRTRITDNEDDSLQSPSGKRRQIRPTRYSPGYHESIRDEDEFQRSDRISKEAGARTQLDRDALVRLKEEYDGRWKAEKRIGKNKLGIDCGDYVYVNPRSTTPYKKKYNPVEGKDYFSNPRDALEFCRKEGWFSKYNADGSSSSSGVPYHPPSSSSAPTMASPHTTHASVAPNTNSTVHVSEAVSSSVAAPNNPPTASVALVTGTPTTSSSRSAPHNATSTPLKFNSASKKAYQVTYSSDEDFSDNDSDYED